MNYSIRLSYLFLLFTLSFLSCKSTAQKGIDLNPTAFKAAIEKESDIIILDVRTPKEVAQGVIPGAKVIDFYGDNFKTELEKLDKDKTYYVYCRRRPVMRCKLLVFRIPIIWKVVLLLGKKLVWKRFNNKT